MTSGVAQSPDENPCLPSIGPFASLDYETETMAHTHHMPEHYHHERIHQGINRIIEPRHEGNDGEIICMERLGGLLKSYHRKAA